MGHEVGRREFYEKSVTHITMVSLRNRRQFPMFFKKITPGLNSRKNC